jgi:peptidoglycan/xylan/chitin deacetylase (PgdA/CDA1 family)
MKKSIRLFIAAAILTRASAGFCQTIAPPYEVASWQGFRTAAVSYTFDDNWPGQFAKALPLFNEFGYHMTFFTVTGTGPAPDWSHADWAGLKDAAAKGHEVASHAVTHTNFNQMKDSVQIAELRNSRDTIETRIPGHRCITFAYPYCTMGKKALVPLYYMAARTCSGVVEARTPPDFMSISSIILGDQGLRKSKDIVSKINAAIKSKGWTIFLIHGVDNDGGWSPLSSDTLRKTLEYLKANDGQFWVTSFGEAARYIRERNAVSVGESSAGDASLTLQVTDTLDNAVFDMPVTLRRPLPEGWPSATVTQGGRGVDSRITEENSTVYVQFDAVPNGGDVVISRSESTGVTSRGHAALLSPELRQNYPNPFNPETVIRFETAGTGQVTLKICDALGREVAVLVNGNLQPGPHSVVFHAGGLKSGTYVCSLRQGGFILRRKMLLLR